MKPFALVNRRFTAEQFPGYVKQLGITKENTFAEFVVLHNTGSPTLAQRPQGLTPQHIQNIADGYENTNHWHAGPHCFVDDHGIVVFSPLTAPGVHSFNWNPISFGVEQLGDFNIEKYDSGRGLLVQKNAIACVATLSHFAGIDSHSMRLHKENTITDHKDCPGTFCADHKGRFMDDVHAFMVAHF